MQCASTSRIHAGACMGLRLPESIFAEALSHQHAAGQRCRLFGEFGTLGCDRGFAAVCTGDPWPLSSSLDWRLSECERVHLVLLFQEFVRRVEAPWSTSLRDFRRWIQLFVWFKHKLNTGPKARNIVKNLWNMTADLLLYNNSQEKKADKETIQEVEKRSIVLAISITHYMRLGTQDLREAFREQVWSVILLW